MECDDVADAAAVAEAAIEAVGEGEVGAEGDRPALAEEVHEGGALPLGLELPEGERSGEMVAKVGEGAPLPLPPPLDADAKTDTRAEAVPDALPLAHGEAETVPPPLCVAYADDAGVCVAPASSDAVGTLLADALLVAGGVSEAPALPVPLWQAVPLPPPPLDAVGVDEATPLAESVRDSAALREGAPLRVVLPVPDTAPLSLRVGLLLPPPEA